MIAIPLPVWIRPMALYDVCTGNNADMMAFIIMLLP